MALEVSKSYPIIDRGIEDRVVIYDRLPPFDFFGASAWFYDNVDLQRTNADPSFRIVALSDSERNDRLPEMRRRAAALSDIAGKLVVLTYTNLDVFGGVILARDFVPLGTTPQYYPNGIYDWTNTLASFQATPLLFRNVYAHWYTGFISAKPSEYTMTGNYKAVLDAVGWRAFQEPGSSSYLGRVAGGDGATTPGNIQYFYGLFFRSTHPIMGARNRLVTGAYVLTEPGRVDSDGFLQHQLLTADINRYYPDRTETTGRFYVERVERLGKLSPRDVLLGAGGRTTIRTVETPAEIDVEGVVTGLDPEVVLRRGKVTLDSKVWLVDSMVDANGAGAHRLTLFRYED